MCLDIYKTDFDTKSCCDVYCQLKTILDKYAKFAFAKGATQLRAFLVQLIWHYLRLIKDNILTGKLTQSPILALISHVIAILLTAKAGTFLSEDHIKALSRCVYQIAQEDSLRELDDVGKLPVNAIKIFIRIWMQIVQKAIDTRLKTLPADRTSMKILLDSKNLYDLSRCMRSFMENETTTTLLANVDLENLDLKHDSQHICEFVSATRHFMQIEDSIVNALLICEDSQEFLHEFFVHLQYSSEDSLRQMVHLLAQRYSLNGNKFTLGDSISAMIVYIQAIDLLRDVRQDEEFDNLLTFLRGPIKDDDPPAQPTFLLQEFENLHTVGASEVEIWSLVLSVLAVYYGKAGHSAMKERAFNALKRCEHSTTSIEIVLMKLQYFL
jgi:hypothetical protein